MKTSYTYEPVVGAPLNLGARVVEVLGLCLLYRFARFITYAFTFYWPHHGGGQTKSKNSHWVLVG